VTKKNTPTKLRTLPCTLPADKLRVVSGGGIGTSPGKYPGIGTTPRLR